MATATGFNQMLQSLAQVDFFTTLLPFVLTYVLLFFVTQGIFKRMDIFPEGKQKTAAAVVSLAFAFYTARFLVMNPVFQQFFLQYLGRVSLIVIGLLGLLIVLSFVGYDLVKKDKNGDATLVGWILILIAIGAFWVSGGMRIFFPSATQSSMMNTFINLLNFGFESGLIWIVVVLGLLLATMRGDNGNGRSPSLALPIADRGDEDNGA